MGIGNRRQHGGEDHVVAPHYPSWGLETRYIAPWKWLPDGSLPLMGIGNTARAATLGGLTEASLPLMGIGNRPPAARPRRGARPSHYPSWGLETVNPTAPSAPGRTSLPLMGIGNRRRPRPRADPPAAHYPSWGLETSGRNHEVARHLDLITPHGDWKPRSGAVAARTMITHYPSWGLETPCVFGS